ncbi:MAG: hypothetical protein AAB262_09160 [Elusimicrobiota bacterium]
MTFKLNLRGSPTGPRSYACGDHGAFELDVDLATSATPRPCPVCGQPSERTLAAPLYKPQRGVVARGKVAPPSRPTDMNTEGLASGQRMSEFRAQRAATWRDHDLREAKAKGLV